MLVKPFDRILLGTRRIATTEQLGLNLRLGSIRKEELDADRRHNGFYLGIRNQPGKAAMRTYARGSIRGVYGSMVQSQHRGKTGVGVVWCNDMAHGVLKVSGARYPSAICGSGTP